MANTTSILPTSLDYTDKDFDALRARMIALVRSVFPTWTDYNVTNFGNLLVELYAFVGDVLTFYQDNQARESRLVTATQMKNVIALAQQLGYEPAGASAAQATETFSIAQVTAAAVVIPAGFVVSTSNVQTPASFQLLAPATIPQGQTSVTGIVENSASFEDDFTSSGLPNQTFTLSNSPYLQNSLSVVASDGTYTEVDNFLDSGSGDRNFVVSSDANGVATITFGNGTNGSIPSGTITCDYKTGGGDAGNVDPGTITNVASPALFDELGNEVTISATNVAKAEGGVAAQTVAQIAAAAPQNLRATTRCVSLEDFEIRAEQVPGVARALMQTSNQNAAIEENTGILYIVPDQFGSPTPTLQAAVLTQVTVTYPSTLTFQVLVQPAPYYAVNIYATIFMKAGTSPATGAANVRAALAAWFALNNADGSTNENVDFGQNYLDDDGNPDPTISLTTLQDVVATAAGIRRVGGGISDFTLNGAHNDLTIQGQQFPVLGTVKLVDGQTGTQL